MLDEPTNHLDLESREALEAALEAFPGAVLLVSHDRALLDAVAERTVAIEEHALRSYDGGWADLVQAREDAVSSGGARGRGAEAEGAAGHESPVEEGRRPSSSRSSAGSRSLEQHVASLEAKLAEDWTNMDMLTEYRTSRDELQELLARWEALFESA